MLVLVALAVAVFARGMQGIAVRVTVVDDAVVRWLAGADLPGFQALMRALSFLSSWWVLNGVLYALIIALLVLRRFRHLIIWLILTNLLALVGASILGPVAQRPRPFGVVIREGWGGWAMPSVQVMFFAASLVVILYTLVPEGRWRNRGKWVVVGLVTLAALGRVALGADAPSDVLVGVALGVTLPLVWVDSTATPPHVGGVAGGVACYWASIGRTLAAWGPLGPWATSNSTVWPSFSER
jgi:membrane-associated phospholipid phosphatase